MDFISRSATIIKEKGPGVFAKKFFFVVWPYRREPADIIEFAFHGGGGIIEPTQVRSELTQMMEVAKELRPKVILEVGTSRGGTAVVFSKLFPDATVISIDRAIPAWRRRVIEALANVTLLERNSHSQTTADEIKKLLNGKTVDFLFIDGDHSLAGVKRDYELFSPFTNGEGCIGFHDILKQPESYDCHVDEFWNELKGEKRELVENRNQGWAGIGILKK